MSARNSAVLLRHSQVRRHANQANALTYILNNNILNLCMRPAGVTRTRQATLCLACFIGLSAVGFAALLVSSSLFVVLTAGELCCDGVAAVVAAAAASVVDGGLVCAAENALARACACTMAVLCGWVGWVGWEVVAASGVRRPGGERATGVQGFSWYYYRISVSGSVHTRTAQHDSHGSATHEQ